MEHKDREADKEDNQQLAKGPCTEEGGSRVDALLGTAHMQENNGL